MSVRSKANDLGSLQVVKVKNQILQTSGVGSSANLSIDQLVRLVSKEGFRVIVTCVKVNHE